MIFYNHIPVPWIKSTIHFGPHQLIQPANKARSQVRTYTYKPAHFPGLVLDVYTMYTGEFKLFEAGARRLGYDCKILARFSGFDNTAVNL